MKPIERGEILGLPDYEAIRGPFRARVIEEKKRRRVLVGPSVSAVFENRDTILLQIQEMLRTERITRESAVRHEIDTYNQLMPEAGGLSATVMIEIPDPAERDSFLTRAKGFEKHIAIALAGERIGATWDESRVLPDRASAVLYVKFALTPAVRAAIQAKEGDVELLVDHGEYRARAKLSRATLDSLAEDLGT